MLQNVNSIINFLEGYQNSNNVIKLLVLKGDYFGNRYNEGNPNHYKMYIAIYNSNTKGYIFVYDENNIQYHNNLEVILSYNISTKTLNLKALYDILRYTRINGQYGTKPHDIIMEKMFYFDNNIINDYNAQLNINSYLNPNHQQLIVTDIINNNELQQYDKLSDNSKIQRAKVFIVRNKKKSLFKRIFGFSLSINKLIEHHYQPLRKPKKTRKKLEITNF